MSREESPVEQPFQLRHWLSLYQVAKLPDKRTYQHALRNLGLVFVPVRHIGFLCKDSRNEDVVNFENLWIWLQCVLVRPSHPPSPETSVHLKDDRGPAARPSQSRSIQSLFESNSPGCWTSRKFQNSWLDNWSQDIPPWTQTTFNIFRIFSEYSSLILSLTIGNWEMWNWW